MKPRALLLISAVATASLLAAAGTGADIPKRRPSVDPIVVGEKQEFTVSYMGFSGLHVETEVLPHETVSGRKAYHMRVRAKSSQLLGVFYHIDDTAESWMDYDGLYSLKFHLVQRESKLDREAWEEHDHSKSVTTYRNSSQRKGETRGTSQASGPIPKFSQDTFSSFFYLRGLPLDTGDQYKIPVVSETNSMHILATVMGGDLIQYRGEKRQAILIRLEKLDAAGNPNPSQNNLVWLSNDDRRLLLRVDVSTRFGHIIGSLRDHTP